MLDISIDGNLLAVALGDTTIQIYNLNNWNLLYSLQEHYNSVSFV